VPILTLAFAGIICFEGPYDDQGTADTPKVDAAFVLDGGHIPQLTVNGATHTSLRTAHGVTDLSFGFSGGATTSSNFGDFVPHLGALTRNGVKLDRGSAGTFRLTLPAIQLDVFAYYPYQAVYGLDGQVVAGPQCVAMVTGLSLTLPVGISISLFGSELALDDDAWVLFENLPPEPVKGARAHAHSMPAGSGPQPRSHFKIHRQVTTAVDDSDIADVYEMPRVTCSKSSTAGPILAHLAAIHPTVQLHPECSNSQWP